MRMNVTLEEAHSILLNLCVPVEESVTGIDESVGRILCRDIKAGRSIPPFNRSAMDGFAVRARDTWNASSENPVRLKIIDRVRAGIVPVRNVESGTVIKIMTGAVIPKLADAVVKFEDAVIDGDSIIIDRTVKTGENIIFTGEDVYCGETIASRGTNLTSTLVGVLAGLGICHVPVYRKVRVAVISTGDELMHPSEEPVYGKIFNSSYSGIMAKCFEAGAELYRLGNIPDIMERVAEKIAEGLENADLIITTGGVSAGDYDVVEDAMKHIEAEILFKGLAVRSGSPMLAAVKNGKLIVALSGNPASAMANFDLTVVMILKKMAGLSRHLPPRIQVVMAENYLKKSPTRRLVRAKLFRKNGIDFVKLTAPHNIGPLMSMIDSNFLVDIPAGSGFIAAGQKVWGFIVGDLEQVYDESSAWIPVVVPSTAVK